jgi:hypothetical protein
LRLVFAVATSGRLYYWNEVNIWYNEKGKWIFWDYSIDISIEAVRFLVVLPNVVVVLFQLPDENKQTIQMFNHSGKSLFSLWTDSELHRFNVVQDLLIFIDKSEPVQNCLR